MKKTVLLFVLLFYLFVVKANTYYSTNSLAPNLTTTWHVNRNGTGASPANFTSGDIFVIQANHSLATTANWTISGTNSKLWIETGATLQGNNKITVPSFQIDGTGIYIHNVNTSAFPGTTTRTFAATSTVELDDWNGSNALPSPTTWGTIIMNVPNGGNLNQAGTLTDVAGSLILRNTGNPGNEMRLATTQSYTLTIGGDLVIEDGVLEGGQNNGNYTQKIIINGSYNQSGGNFTRSNNNANIMQIEFNGANSNFTKTGGTITNTYMNWVVNASQKLTLNNSFEVATSRTFTVNGTLVCDTNQVTGTGAFIQASTGTISTANISGVDGSIQVTGTQIYTSGGSYEFHAATTTPFPAALASVTAGSVVVDANVSFNKNVSVTNTLNLATGKLTIPTSLELTVASGSTITGSGFGVTKHIVTQVNTSTGAMGMLRVTSLTGTATFPIGNGTYYLPATLTTVSAFSFNMCVFQGLTKNGTPNGIAFTTSQKAYAVDAVWIVNKNSGSGTVTIKLLWPSTLQGSKFPTLTNSDIGIAHYGTYWESPLGSGDHVQKTVTRTGIVTFSPFGIGKVGIPLPLNFGDLKIYKNNDDLHVNWSTYDEVNVDHFEIERSQNGHEFVKAGNVNAKGNGIGGRTDYDWIDPSPFSGTSFYRVKEIDIDGESKYSSVVRISIGEDNSKLNLFPNPVVDKRVSVQVRIDKGLYNVTVTNLDGRNIYNETLNHSGGIISQNIKLPSTTSSGMYLLMIRGSGVNLFKQFVVK
jgi:hypothetical protein